MWIWIWMWIWMVLYTRGCAFVDQRTENEKYFKV
jgi:hypothetical protein